MRIDRDEESASQKLAELVRIVSTPGDDVGRLIGKIEGERQTSAARGNEKPASTGTLRAPGEV